MKVGSAVLGLHVTVLCVFALTQGCVTTESQGSGRGAGARHKGPWKHVHPRNTGSQAFAQGDGMYEPVDVGGTDSIYNPVIIEDASSTPEPMVEPSPTTESYIVQKGDMLSQLAVDFDTTVKTLVSLNQLTNPDVLYVGQELRVPAGRAPSKTIRKKPSASIAKGGGYVIQKGDTLSGIALAAGVSIDDLRALNNLNGDEIFAGETLYIPSYGNVPTKTQKSVAKKSKPAPVEPAPAVSAPEPAPLAPVAPAVEPVESAMTFDMVQDHVVYPGETLEDIARQYGVSKSEIMRMNNISDPTAISEGQRLRIPVAE